VLLARARFTLDAWRADREIHGQEKPATFAGLEDFSSQSRQWNRFNRYVRRPDDFVSAIVWYCGIRGGKFCGWA
jgi:hypothetical protein